MKTLLLLMLCITTGHLVIAQDTVILKNGKTIGGKIISLSYGIKLLRAKDTINYTADEVASIMFCNENRNCPNSDLNGKSNSTIKGEKLNGNPCNCLPKQYESKLPPKSIDSRNNKY